jgi:hypothetical protein
MTTKLSGLRGGPRRARAGAALLVLSVGHLLEETEAYLVCRGVLLYLLVSVRREHRLVCGVRQRPIRTGILHQFSLILLHSLPLHLIMAISIIRIFA